MDYYRWAATEDFPECIEVWHEETPWTVPEPRPWYQRAPLLLPRIVPRIIFQWVKKKNNSSLKAGELTELG